MQVFMHWVIGTWKSLHQNLVVPTPFEDGKESEESGRHQTSQEKRSEILVCAFMELIFEAQSQVMIQSLRTPP